MRTSPFALLGSLLLLAGCATPNDALTIELEDIHPSVEHIHYSFYPPPFCDGCDSVDLLVQQDGLVRWQHSYSHGDYADERSRIYQWQLPAQNIARFTDSLARFRQPGVRRFDETNCRPFQPDGPSVRVTWHNGGDSAQLVFDGACRSEPLMESALFDAPFLLGTPRTPGLVRQRQLHFDPSLLDPLRQAPAR